MLLLYRIHLNLRCKKARRDISDPYQMHSTLCRAFCPPDMKCPEGEFLWRLEPESDAAGNPRVLIQSHTVADWSSIGIGDWLASEPENAVDLDARLKFKSCEIGRRFRYRLRANPCVTRNGKRLGLMQREEQAKWFIRKGGMHGFFPETMHISQEQMLYGKRHDGGGISVFSVLFDGVLKMTDREKFCRVVDSGIGHGKAMGLGFLSIAPLMAKG